jgi:hypothetical protein
VGWKSLIEEYEAKTVGMEQEFLQVSFGGDSGECLAVMSGSELVGCHSDLFGQHDRGMFNGVGVAFVIYRHRSSAKSILALLFVRFLT